MSERALVLGGGRSAGNAWLIGVVAGLAVTSAAGRPDRTRRWARSERGYGRPPGEDELRTGGSTVESIVPDADSLDALGTDMMDPSTRQPAARAGYVFGRRAAQLTRLWH